MNKRTYGQYCGLAHALDILGERWTLLIVRELLTGPKRYKDLLKHLSGIGTNLLAARLKYLEEEGVITRRMLPPPASTEAYNLTERGLALEPALVELARWGLSSIGRPEPDAAYGPHWSILAMKAVFRPERARGIHASYEFRVDHDVFHARIEDGTLTSSQGTAVQPDFVMETDAQTYLAVVSGKMTTQEAINQGLMTLEGNLDAWKKCGAILDLSPIHQNEDDTLKVMDLTGRPAAARARRLR